MRTATRNETTANARHAEPHKGFSRDELTTAFSRCHGGDWRGRIDCYVAPDQVEVSVAAIDYFTATTATRRVTEMKGLVRLIAAGYRMRP